MKLKKAISGDFLCLIVLLTGILYFLKPLMAKGSVLFFQDIGFYFHPLHKLVADLIHDLKIPQWNPYMELGRPLSGDITLGIFYPPNLLNALLPLELSHKVLVIFHFLITGYFTFKLARELEIHRAGSLLVAICYTLSGPVVSYTTNFFYLESVPWFPGVLWMHLRALKTQSYKYSLVTGIFLSMLFLAGDIQSIFHIIPFILLFSYKYFKKYNYLIIHFFTILLVFMGFCLVQIIPALNLWSGSIRKSGLSYEEIRAWSFHPQRLLTFILPYFWGSILPENSYWGFHLVNSTNPDRFWFFSIYSGIITIIFSVYSLFFFRKNVFVLFFAVLFIFFMILSFGIYTPVHKIICQFIPLLSSVRYPEKFILPAVFSLAFLSGLGFHFLRDDLQDLRSKNYLFIILCLILFILLGIIIMLNSENLGNFISPYCIIGNFTSALSRIKSDSVHLVIISIFSLITFLITRKIHSLSMIFLWIFPFLAFMDVYGVNMLCLWTGHKSFFSTPPDTAQEILKREATQKDLFRIYWYPDPGLEKFPKNLYGERQQHLVLKNMLMPNSGITMGLSYLIGYSGSSLGTTKILEDFMKKDPVSTGKRFNVKYIIFPLNLIGQQINDAVSHGSLIPVMNIPLCNGALFEINQFSPRFYITRTGEIYSGYETSFPDLLDHIKEKPQKYAAVDCSLMMKGGKSLSMDKLVLEKLKNLLHDDMHDQYTSDYSIKLKEYSTDKIFIETFSQEPGLFICEDNYYNGWRVYVDKIESEILKVNGCLRGVILESGNHQIELCYSTQSLKTCFVLYVLFVSGTALGFSVYFLKKFQLV